MTVCPACGFENIEGAEVCEHCGDDLTHLSRPRAESPIAKTLHKEPVSSLRSHPPVIVTRNRKVLDVIASLVMHDDGCAVVVDDDGKLIGVFSERDLVNKVAGREPDLMEHPVAEFMTPDPVTIRAHEPIAFALHQMDIGGYRHIPVVEDDKPVGMVSIRDIVTFIGNRFLLQAGQASPGDAGSGS